MRNGVPSGTPFCLRGLSGPAAAAGGRSPNLLGDGCGGPEAMPEMSAVADPAARVQRATCTREASPGMKAAGSTGYHEPRWLPGTLYRYTAAGIDVRSERTCEAAGTHANRRLAYLPRLPQVSPCAGASPAHGPRRPVTSLRMGCRPVASRTPRARHCLPRPG